LYITNIDYLILAYRIAMLTFYTGVLIYALPIPIRGLKRWAPTLIEDSIVAAILILILDVLFNIVNRLVQLAGGSWQYFNAWEASAVSFLLTLKGILALIESLPSPTGVLGGLKSAAYMLDRMVTSAVYFQGLILGLAWLVKHYAGPLASVGAILYALPFRVGRSAGAWLIAFSLVFSGGLQVLPVFVSTIGGPSIVGPGTAAKYGVALANVTVTGPGGPLDGALRLEKTDGSILALRPLRDGKPIGSLSRQGILIPSRIPVVYTYEYLGVYFNLTPYPTYPSNYTVQAGVWAINLSTPYAVVGGHGVLLYTDGNVVNVTLMQNSVTAKIELPPGGYIEERHASQCDAQISSEGAAYRVEDGSWSWAGIKGAYTRLIYDNGGEAVITYSWSCSNPPLPRLNFESYVTPLSIVGSFYTINFIKMFIVYFFTLPSLYLLMLYSLTHGLSRLLGGRERLFLRL